MRQRFLWLVFGLAAGLLWACSGAAPVSPASPTPQAILSTPPSQATPSPAAPDATAAGLPPATIRIYDEAGATKTLTPTDAAYAPVHTALNTLLSAIDGQLRTLYDDARYQSEIARLARLEADYGGDVTLPSTNPAVKASRVTAVIVDGQTLVLARASADPAWGVYTSSATAFEALRAAVQTHTSVNLQP